MGEANAARDVDEVVDFINAIVEKNFAVVA